MKRKASIIALCGIVTALSIVLMSLTYITPNLTYALPAIAGALLVIIVIEINIKYALMCYISVAILSILLIPDKFSVILYSCFFGYYPVLKAILEKAASNITRWIFKLLCFNAAVALAAVSGYFIFSIKYDMLSEYAQSPAGLALLIGANIIFVLYDIAVDNVIGFYNRRLGKILRKYMQ